MRRRRRTPLLLAWTATLMMLAAAVVLGLTQPWQPTEPRFDPVAAAAAAAAWDKAHPRPVEVTVIGDSYTGGSAMGGTDDGKNWASIAFKAPYDAGVIGAVTKATAGGSGYVTRGPQHAIFGELVAQGVKPTTDLVMFFGSRNDAGESGIEGAAAAAFAAAKKIAPGAALLVVGPPWINGDVPPAELANRDAVQAAARAAGATFVDPLADGWFSGAAAKLIGADGVHPTDAGHAYMADKLRQPVEDAVAAAARGRRASG